MEFDPRILDLADKNRLSVQRELGMRSLYHFFRMAWRVIDPNKFIDNWHIRLLCEELQAAACRQNRNLVINIPPRHGKSLLVSVAFPAWVWTWWPSAKFITASYDLRMATRDSVSHRNLVSSSWYQSLWGDRVKIMPDQDQKTFWKTTAGGHRFVTTPSAGVTGEGADFITADDPHNVRQAESDADRATVDVFWFEAIPSRLNNPNAGVKVVIQQRVHEQDLAGKCLQRGYRPVVLPAIFEADHPHVHEKDPRKEGELLWPSRIDRPTLDQLMLEMGQYAVAGQLQQRPAPREGGMFKRHWFSVHKAAPAEAVTNCVRRWDLAAAVMTGTGSDPDWTVGVKMGRDNVGRFWILDVQRFRLSPAQGLQAMKAMAHQDGLQCRVGIPQDPGQAGLAQVQYIVGQMAPFSVFSEKEGSDVIGNKVRRAEPFSAQCEVGNVGLVDGPWVEDFLNEVCSFPAGRHDDQVDAASGAFRMLTGPGAGMLDFMRQEAMMIEEIAPPSTERVERHVFAI